MCNNLKILMDEETTQIKQLKNKNSGRLLGIGLALILASAAFLSGFEIGSGGKAEDTRLEAGLLSFFRQPSADPAEVDMAEFWRVWNILEDKFVGSAEVDLTSEGRLEGAIHGLVSSYEDPYTIYLNEEDSEQFEDDISGNFSGVGMEVGMREGLITVIAPLPDSPAEKAGVLAGDVVVEIDGTDTGDMTIDEAVKLIRGEQGAPVELTVYRENELEFKTIEIIRDVITIPTLDTEVVGDVFVIKLYNFNALSEGMMTKAVNEFDQSVHDKLILDLRGNPGGFLHSAVSISSLFLPGGEVVVRENFGEDVEVQLYRTSGGTIVDMDSDDFVVLIDGGSASASEIVAGALSEHGVATTLGERTFGKGSVQELVDLPSGSSVKVTVARWLTPNGVSFSEGGLEPNVTITRTPQQVLAGEDPQLDAALEWLKGNQNIGEQDLAAELQATVNVN